VLSLKAFISCKKTVLTKLDKQSLAGLNEFDNLVGLSGALNSFRVASKVVEIVLSSVFMFDSLPPKTAFSRFPPVHRTDQEGRQRVEGGSPYAVRATLRKGGKRAFPRVERAGKRRRPSRIAGPCPANADPGKDNGFLERRELPDRSVDLSAATVAP
jgi:hypothetical protein